MDFPLQPACRHPTIRFVALAGPPNTPRPATRTATADRDVRKSEAPISTAHLGDARPSETPFNAIPRPRAPLADSIRRILPRPETPTDIDVDEVCADLAEVAVRTCSDGSWQEHACFLLGSSSGKWQVVPFSHPVMCQLIGRLRTLPGFDDNQLLDLLGSQETEIVVLWRDPSLTRSR